MTPARFLLAGGVATPHPLREALSTASTGTRCSSRGLDPFPLRTWLLHQAFSLAASIQQQGQGRNQRVGQEPAASGKPSTGTVSHRTVQDCTGSTGRGRSGPCKGKLRASRGCTIPYRLGYGVRCGRAEFVQASNDPQTGPPGPSPCRTPAPRYVTAPMAQFLYHSSYVTAPTLQLLRYSSYVTDLE